MYKPIIATIIVLMSYITCHIYAQEVSFSELVQIISSTQATISNSTTSQISQQLCVRTDQADHYIISASCLVQQNIPTLGLEESIQLIRPYIQGFDTSYDLSREQFTYYGEQPELDEKTATQAAIRHHPQWKKGLEGLILNGKNISIPKYIIAIWQSAEYGWYVTPRLLQGSKCSQTNYRVAITSLNNLLLQPGEVLNFNKHIDNLPGYCKGVGNQNLMFFGGVCGASSQLFRTSLLIPSLTVTKREPHSQRYTQYYSDAVWGDDAAIYQMSKQFEIRNDGQEPVYFKTFETKKTSYLVAIRPKQEAHYIKITKQQIGKLRGIISKDIIDRTNNTIVNTQSRTSQYQKKNTSWF